MSAMHNKYWLIAALIAVVGGVLPIIGYQLAFGRVQSISPGEAKYLLDNVDGNVILVDVRPADNYAAGHIEAAVNWPYERIASLDSEKAVPGQFAGKRLLLICQSGISSALAAQKLQNISSLDVVNVRGGMQAWVAGGENPCSLGLCRLKLASGQSTEFPFRESSSLEQWATVITGFGVKPLYTTLSFLIILALWRQKSSDLTALRWAMIFFFIGENFCAANYLIYTDGSVLFEYLHSYGMVMCFALTTYALLEGVDTRIIKLSEPESRCAALGLCGKCIKYIEVPCGLKRVFLLMIPAAMVLCLMPFCADFMLNSYNTNIFGTFYNQSHLITHQIFEIRYLPLVAFLLFVISWLLLIRLNNNAIQWSKIFFSAGIGSLGFCLFRLVLLQVYRDNLTWFAIWEEITELLFILSVIALLWIFRNSIFHKSSICGQKMQTID